MAWQLTFQIDTKTWQELPDVRSSLPRNILRACGKIRLEIAACSTLWCWVHDLSRQVGTLLSQDRVIGAMVCVRVDVELYIGGCIEWVEFVHV